MRIVGILLIALAWSRGTRPGFGTVVQTLVVGGTVGGAGGVGSVGASAGGPVAVEAEVAVTEAELITWTRDSIPVTRFHGDIHLSAAEKEAYLRSDTELWVEATTRTFTQLSGRFSSVPGRIDLVLAGYR